MAVKNDEMQASRGDAIASQAREILRTVNTQLRIVQQTNGAVPKDILYFAN